MKTSSFIAALVLAGIITFAAFRVAEACGWLVIIGFALLTLIGMADDS